MLFNLRFIYSRVKCGPRFVVHKVFLERNQFAGDRRGPKKFSHLIFARLISLAF